MLNRASSDGELTLYTFLRAIPMFLFTLVILHEDQKRGHSETRASAELGDGVFDPNLRETRGDDHQLGLEMGAGSDRGVESAAGNLVADNHVHHCGEVYKHIGGVVLQGDGAGDNVIAHNLDFSAALDYIIDLGPKGGDQGGTIVPAEPRQALLRRTRQSHTAKALKHHLRAAPRPVAN